MQRMLVLAALALSPMLASAQALPNPPAQQPAAAPASAFEQELAKVKSVPALEQLASKSSKEKDFARVAAVMKRLLELRPFNPGYRYTLGAAHAEQDQKSPAYDALVKLQMAGLAYDVAKDPRYAKVHGTEVWDYLVLNLQANARAFGEGKVAYTLPGTDLLIESLAWDPAAKQLLAGSAREGKVFRVGAGGKLAELVKADAANGLWAVMDMAVDAPHNALWVASAAIPHFAHALDTDYGRAGVFRFALDSGKLVSKHEVPIDGLQHLLSSIAVTPKGDVFVADGVRRTLYKVEAQGLRQLFANSALTGIRGMAATDKTLYFADYEIGLFGLDLATGQPFQVIPPPNVTLYSIDGLGYWNGHLVAVQNGFPPARVMRFKLSDDGRRITLHQPVEAGRPEWGTPTRGVVAGDTWYFLSNSQKSKYDGYGVLRANQKLEPTRVFASGLDFAMREDGGQLKPIAVPE